MTAADENEFIVPPPGMAPKRVEQAPTPPAAVEESGAIVLPPGLVDSGTFRMPPRREPAAAAQAAEIPVFFPVTAPGMPVEEEVSATSASASAPLVEQHYAPPRLDDAIALAPAPAPATSTSGVDDAIDEETHFASGDNKAPATLLWRLTLADGTKIELDCTTLFGRDPAANAQWPNARLLPISDPSKSVSKTHAALQVTAEGEVHVHDLHSTNGVYVMASGTGEIAVRPGSAQLLTSGAQVRLGQFVIIVERSETLRSVPGSR
ncbi:FHA domain-containing protein [Salinibacterium sp. SWN139]|uniref:FHA domain-containing protein n=1 Tax=Salinibacterium sp. SWN139 TaxID=2792055 RepID=UPI0018CE796D|nr:FHA domain-containing protein [Salinibacterium sp. SWN139]MBH0053709.1 FHA domain-containing protein [Salinibacterium sp. SWN139]